jgi:hypothetical protein
LTNKLAGAKIWSCHDVNGARVNEDFFDEPVDSCVVGALCSYLASMGARR